MLEVGKTYQDNKHKLVTIGGRVKIYSPDRPWVWSVCGDWFDEVTGAFVWYTRSGGHALSSVDAMSSIKDHSVVDTKSLA